MRPKGSTLVYRPDLGQYVMEFMEAETMNFIGLQIMPIFPAAEASASFPVIPVEAMMSIEDTRRAPRTSYGQDDWEYERGKFSTVDRGWKQLLDDTERKLIEGEFYTGFADQIAVERASKIILRAQEKRIADKVFDAATFTANAVSNEWDGSSATPFDDIKDAVSAFRLQCGMLTDTLVMSYAVFQNLKRCSQIIDQVKYTFPMMTMQNVSPQQLAQALGVPRILVGGSVYNSAGKGLDVTVADIWDDEYVALLKTSASMDITEPCFGRTFLWKEDSPSNAVVESYRDEDARSDAFRVRHNVDERLIQSFSDSDTVVSNIAARCIYLLSNITS